ncbi:hypothetical protein [Actinomadura sp. 6N118]|uniref:hypothetical protein n=1 Tax=Actinomadura sp. 6N118 TaxID=3375151 RepID=UPI0037AC94B7
MEFRVQMERLTFLVADLPEQRRKFETGELRTSDDGRPLFQVRLLAMDGQGSAPIKVGVEGDPGLGQGAFVRPVGLVLNSIERKGDVVMWWTADRLEITAPPNAAANLPDSAAGTAVAASGKAAQK